MAVIIGCFDLVDGQFGIVSKTFWDANRSLDGDGLPEDLEDQLPEGFYALAESVYEHDFDSEEEAIQALEAAGFERVDMNRD